MQCPPARSQIHHPARLGARPDCRVNRRPPCTRCAAGGVSGLLQLLPNPAKQKASAASKEMQRLMASGSEDVAAFSQAVDVLLESRLAFQEQSLGGGEWQVVYTRGRLLWQQITSPGRAPAVGRLSYKSKRKAGQTFDPAGRSALNRGDLIPGLLSVQASGTYEPQGSAARLPLNVQANIKGGELLIGSFRVPLPISGTGQFSVMYVDPDIRVFSDPQRGTVSVQMKASRLEQLLN